MNQTLENMATTLFKEWFENFNFPNSDGKPYKVNGGEMKTSELGEIPVDWKVKRIFETDIVIEDGDRGKNYPNNSELSNKGFCPFLNNKNIIGDYINFDKTDFITEEKFNVMGKGIVRVYDIVLTTRGSIGNVGLFHKNLPFKFSRINSGMVIIKNNKDFTCNYLYTVLKSKEMKSQFMSISSGSVQKQLPIRDLKNLVLLKPLKNIQSKFEDIISPILEQIQQNQQQNQTLKQQRDTLLPKLMSGEIRV
jgi:type I restriction enzyme, S subunit